LAAEAFAHLACHLEPAGSEREAHRVNAWLARSQRLGAPSVQKEVQAWDVDGLPPVFRLAGLILLGEDEQGLALLGELREQDVISQEALDRWPLFARWRSGRLV